MFPGAGARVYRNEEGEPLGWDYPAYDEPEYDPDDYLSHWDEDDEDDDEDEDYDEDYLASGEAVADGVVDDPNTEDRLDDVPVVDPRTRAEVGLRQTQLALGDRGAGDLDVPPPWH